jgi:2-dehydro-3-deoxyphosphogluconate aldolase/(4S)-4-hydroxy-2-oxoglutarate aldolase
VATLQGVFQDKDMAAFDRITVSTKLGETGVVPVFYHPDADLAYAVIKACYEGGIRAVEFTNRGDRAHLVFEKVIVKVRMELPELALGVGSVLDAGSTSLYLQLGADFIVSPALVPEMAAVCNRRKVLWSPGCGSVSEIVKAHELGAEIVKIFPGSEVGGPSFVKAVKGPMPWTKIMPTGGVSPTEENLKAWFSAGVHCVGMGSKLITKDLLQNFDHDQLKNQVTSVLALLKSIR